MNFRDPIFLSIEDKLVAFSKEISAIYNRLNQNQSALKDLQDKYFEIDKLKPLNDKFADLKKDVVNHKSVIDDKCFSLKQEFEVLKNNLDEWKTSLSVLANTVVYWEKTLNDLRIYVDSKFHILEQNYQNELLLVRKELQEAIASLKKDVMVSPKDIFKQNQDMMQKVESACLDGTNAMLKVNNQETQFRILEKKIESIFIQLKKFELSLEERKV